MFAYSERESNIVLHVTQFGCLHQAVAMSYLSRTQILLVGGKDFKSCRLRVKCCVCNTNLIHLVSNGLHLVSFLAI